MINRVVLVGRLTKDVEVRKTQSGISSARFTVACDRRVSRDANPNQPTADFIGCVAWRQSADFLGQYAHKGNVVAVDGHIQTGSYERDGQRIYTTDVVVDSVRLIREQRAETGSYNSDTMNYNQPSNNSANPEPSNQGFGDDDFGNGGFDLSTDDLPF
ncbi:MULTISPECIES: single-stranded DNA-binding protein [Terrabacteria group]|uniref:single-stranded DNA-binding protein n=1 Tax=Bacillati TaxID=1783272 RepID=UPI0019394695|nr:MULTISPECIES: single-stranded DNA-binding protein [Terrabacteria group]MBW9212659.1 single-stranded DNA-binding protein [Trueperella sp. zg.1013]QRG86854.1 single-stranded DNA-binding protein [Bulleidia sp. zg-1006]